MEEFFYFRVPKSSLRHFAALAINSNSNHPAHKRNKQTNKSIHDSITQRIDTSALSISSLVKDEIRFALDQVLENNSSPFPPPLLSLILNYTQISTVVSGEANGTFKLWSLSDWNCLDTLISPYKDYVTASVFLQDQKTFVTGALDGVIHFYSKQREKKEEEDIQNNYILSAKVNQNKEVEASLSLAPILTTPSLLSSSISLSLSPSSLPNQWHHIHHLAEEGEIHSLHSCYIEDPASGNEFDISSVPSTVPRPPLPILLVGTSQSALLIYDLTSNARLASAYGHTAKISGISSFSPTFTALFSSSPPDNNSDTSSLHIPITRQIITSSWDGTVRVWCPKRWQSTFILTANNKPLMALATSSQHQVFAVDIVGTLTRWTLPPTSFNQGSSQVRESSLSAQAHYTAFSPAINSISVSFSPHLLTSYSVSSNSGMPSPVSTVSNIPSDFSLNVSSSSLYCVSCIWCASGDLLLLVAGADGLIRIYENSHENWLPVAILNDSTSNGEGAVLSMLLIGENRILAGMNNKCINVWNVSGLVEKRGKKAQLSEESEVRASDLFSLEKKVMGFTRSVRSLALAEILDIIW